MYSRTLGQWLSERHKQCEQLYVHCSVNHPSKKAVWTKTIGTGERTWDTTTKNEGDWEEEAKSLLVDTWIIQVTWSLGKQRGITCLLLTNTYSYLIYCTKSHCRNLFFLLLSFFCSWFEWSGHETDQLTTWQLKVNKNQHTNPNSIRPLPPLYRLETAQDHIMIKNWTLGFTIIKMTEPPGLAKKVVATLLFLKKKKTKKKKKPT